MGILNKIVEAGSKVATAPDNEAAGLKAKSDSIKQYMDATGGKAKPEPVANPSRPVSSVDRVGNAPHKSLISDADAKDWSKPLGSFAKGTTKVKKTQAAVVHKGEAIIPAHENPMNDDMYGPTKSLGNKDKDKPKVPKKEIRKIHTSKTHDGKFLHVHEHHNSAHPDEQHVSNDVAEMQEHMAANEPQMTASPSPMPPEGAPQPGA